MSLQKLSLAIILFFSMAFGDSNLTIYRDYNKTLEMAKKENRPIFILFTKKECQWCEKLKSNLLINEKIERELKSDYLVLFLDKESDEYPKKYHIEAVPDVLLISETEEIYHEILGYHSNPKDYLKWFRYVRIERD